MATVSQITANRENSQHSTGPTSTSGKSTSSRNSLKHGLASGTLIIKGESEDAFNTLLDGLIAEHQPTTLTETLLVQDMAKYHWLIDRALGLQSEVLANTLAATSQIAPELGLLIRYQTANERAFQKAFAMLNLMRKNALLTQPISAPQPEIGSAPQTAPEADREAPPTPLPFDMFAPPSDREILRMAADGFIFNFATNSYDCPDEIAA